MTVTSTDGKSKIIEPRTSWGKNWSDESTNGEQEYKTNGSLDMKLGT